MPRVPIAGDLSEVIGDFAERVENRSLLLDKFAFHKRWGTDDLKKANDAHRWSLLRISEGGSALLTREAEEKRAESVRVASRNPDKSEQLRTEAQHAAALAATRVDSTELAQLRGAHTRRLVGLFSSAFDGRSVAMVAQLEGRLAINLADSLIQNAGISLDRLFGLPFIAGSAIKGACRHAALEELKAADGLNQPALLATFMDVFGTADTDFLKGDLKAYESLLKGGPANVRGRVSFLPAYPVNEARLVVDLTNVHHPEYYRTGRIESLSNELPQPNPFPTVERGAQFAFLLVLNRPDASPDLLGPTYRWLEAALTVRGLGAKTAAGYGWFSLQPTVLDEIKAKERMREEKLRLKARQEAEAKTREEAESARLAALPAHEAAKERFKKLGEDAFASAASGLATLPPEQQRGLLLALMSPEKKDTWKRWRKSDKANSKARVEALLAAARSLGVPLP